MTAAWRWLRSAVIGSTVFVALAAAAALAVARSPRSDLPVLAPWVVLTAVVVAIVVVSTPRDRRRDPIDPVAVALATFFVPMGVIGATLYAAGVTQPYHTALISDPRRSLPLAQCYLILGLVGVVVGSRSRLADWMARLLDRRVPRLGLDERELGPALLALHVLAAAAIGWAFARGYVGYQTVATGRVGAVPGYLATMTIPTRVALGAAWVRSGAQRSRWLICAALATVGLLGVEWVLLASRAVLVTAALSLLFGALAGGWRPRAGRLALGIAALAVVSLLAASFATNLRERRATPTGRVTFGEQVDLARAAAGDTLADSWGSLVSRSVQLAAGRLEVTGQMAVVVDREPEQRAAEAAAGIDHSVPDIIVAGLVPRLLWPGKPDAPTPQQVGAVYFEFDGNAFATTPMTDLLRNYGPVGVPVGMGLLGIALGALGGFRRRRGSIATAMVSGALLLRAVSYESFYGTIVADGLRVGAVAAGAAVFLRLASRPAASPAAARPAARTAAVLVPDVVHSPGLAAAARGTASMLQSQGWGVRLVSLATSSRDRASGRLLAPGTWRGPRVFDEEVDGVAYRHVGCWATELWWMRMRPRRALSRELTGVDAIWVEAGSPAWALVVPGPLRPRVLVRVAALAKEETRSAEREGPRWRRWFWTTYRLVATRLEKRAIERVGAVAAYTSAAELARRDRSGAVEVLPHAIGRVEGAPGPGGGPFLAVGNWPDRRKNLRLLLEAHAEARGAAPVPDLLLVGFPPGQGDPVVAGLLREAGDRVRVLGVVDDDELARLRAEATAFVSSSDQEGFGIVIAEALAAGCPVVATRSGGAEELIDDEGTGLLVPVGDASALAAALVRVGREPGLRGRLAAAAPASVGHLEPEVLAPRLDDALNSVAVTVERRPPVVAYGWLYQGWGGAELQLLQLARHRPAGTVVLAFGPATGDRSLRSAWRAEGVRWHGVEGALDLAPARNPIDRIARRLHDRAAGEALLDAFAPLPASTVAHLDLPPWSTARTIRRLAAERTVVIGHHTPMPAIGGAREAVLRWRYRRLGRLGGLVVAASSGPARDDAASWYRRHVDTIALVLSGIDPVEVDAIVDAAPPRSSRPAGALEVVGVGALEPRKGIDVAIDAVARLREKSIDARLVWFGRGGEGEALEMRATTAGVGDFVQVKATAPGSGGRAELLGAVARADVYVQPSRVDGLPVATLEALALATPVVATRVGSMAELDELGPIVTWVPVDDVAALAQAIVSAAADPRRGTAGREAVMARYDMAAQARSTFAWYRGLATDVRGRRPRADSSGPNAGP